MENIKINIISLGCPKNLVDSETVLGFLAENGAVVVSDPAEAEVIVINTCAFIQSAVEETIETILEMARYKDNGAARLLVVLGCFTERFSNQLEQSLPEVDLFWGTGALDRLPERISSLLKGDSIEPESPAPPGFIPKRGDVRLRSAPFYSAYLKIAEGCSNRCSYCLIPSLRGPMRSRPLADLVEEAAALASTGAKELILVAQDTTAYGRDLEKGTNLARLIRELAQIDDLHWIRVMYAYPNGLTAELKAVMSEEPKVCRYLDLPLQHASPSVLKRMRRAGPKNMVRFVEQLREDIPGLSLRTTFIVGFPGETDKDFQTLMDFVRAARFEHLGVFKFSPEEGTAAAKYPDQVPQRLKENRRRKVMALQRRISRELNRKMIGRTFPVLVEGASAETDLLLTGRLPGQAPEIDGRVLINDGAANRGEIRPVLITEAFDYDVVGQIVEPVD